MRGRYYVLLFWMSAACIGAELKVGVGQVNINPPLGIGLAGYYHERGNEGVLDDIAAKATVFDDGTTRAAIVVCDLISMPRWVVGEARKLVEAETGIPGAHVMIAATHTHTAPVLYKETISDLVSGGAKAIAQEYSRSLPKRIAEAVVAADKNRRAVRVSVAKEVEYKLGYNRRFWMRDGSVGWNPGKVNPQVIRPAGPIDPEVGLFYAETIGPKPEPVLSFVNYAMHPDTTSGTKISADYPGALARVIATYKGPEMLTIFANGTCGNINHLDVHWRGQQSSPQEANRLGTILGAAVFKAFPQLQAITNTGALQVRHEMVKLPLAAFTAEELAEAGKDAESAKDNSRVGFMKLVRAYRILETEARKGEPMEVEMQVITLGRHAAWVSWPGEIFVELGLSVKAASQFPNLYNVELANGAIGYIPNKPAYIEGNYEVESARVAAGAGEKLVESAVRMLDESYKMSND
jgi:neutral ceramidase